MRYFGPKYEIFINLPVFTARATDTVIFSIKEEKSWLHRNNLTFYFFPFGHTSDIRHTSEDFKMMTYFDIREEFNRKNYQAKVFIHSATFKKGSFFCLNFLLTIQTAPISVKLLSLTCSPRLSIGHHSMAQTLRNYVLSLTAKLGSCLTRVTPQKGGTFQVGAGF